MSGPSDASLVSRRDLLAMTAGVFTARFGRVRPASQPKTAVAFDVPSGACDCHTHVFGDPQRFPFVPGRTYTPEPASVAEMRALHRALHTTRVVVVQPSVYGTDNRCTLDAIQQLGAEARGVAVIDDGTSDAALDEMNERGIRGIRINLATAGQTDPDVGRRRFDAAIARLGRRRWHIQMYTQLPMIVALHKELSSSPVPIVFDHFGGARASGGTTQAGFDALLELVRSGRAYVKVSAPYRGSTKEPDFSDMAPLARALIGANVQRVLWGTDWPHPDTSQGNGRKPTDISTHRQIDDGRVFNELAVWAPTAGARRTILVENPRALYGFAGG